MVGRSKTFWVAVLLSSTLLAGCKSGGSDSIDSGGGSTGSSTLQPTDSEVLRTFFVSSLDSLRTGANRLMDVDARYQRQTVSSGTYVDKNNNGRFDTGVDVRLGGNPIEDAGIHYAHAAGLTGAGQVIAFSDSGFLTTHEAFDSTSITTGSGLGTADHGTFVASIATGISDDMIGVAPGADAIFGSFNTLSQLSETANAAAAADAVALNNSWGFSSLSANSADYNSLFGTSSGSSYLNALRNYADDGVVIFAVSNDRNLSTAGLMSGLPSLVPSLEPGWLAVVNGVPETVGDDVVSAHLVSGGCLQAAAWCMAANGSWTGATADGTGSYEFGTGSSYAAPMVAGALALLAEAFPDMSNHDLRVRLLASADNDFDGFTRSGTVELAEGFEHAYSDEFGHGFLDVAAALLPIGQATLTTGNGTVLNSEEPLVVAGSASGDAVVRALQDVEVVSADALSASFAIDASQMIALRPAAPLFGLNDALHFERSRDPRFGASSFFGTGQDFAMRWADTDFDVSLFQTREAGNDRFGFGLRRSYDLGAANLVVGAAVGEDTLGLLSDWNGGTSASIMSLDMALTTSLSPNAHVTMALGYAAGQEASSLGQSADVFMNGGSLSLSRQNAWTHNDNLRLSLSLPAAIFSGSTSVALPVTNALGETTHRSIGIDLAPEDREVRLELSYERPFSKRASWGVALAHAENRGNISGLRETAVMFGVRTRF